MNAKPAFYVKAHTDYYIGEEKKEQKFKMISHIDDMLILIDDMLKISYQVN